MLLKGPATASVIYKYLSFKGATNSNCNMQVAYYSLKGAQTATLLCKYYTFKGVPHFQRCPSTISSVQIKRSFKPTSIPKKW